MKKRPLSVICEDDFESNFSEKDEKEVKRINKLSDSDWNSQLGATEKGGYKIDQIRWTDLGRKYIFKKEKSKWAELEESSDNEQHHGRWNTIDQGNYRVDAKDLRQMRIDAAKEERILSRPMTGGPRRDFQ